MPEQEYTLINQFSYPRLTRSLNTVESWGFGLTAHISWVALVPAIHAALGSQAIFVWIPAVIVGMLINYQVKRLGTYFIDVAGGTPNYISHLLKPYPGLARYAAIGYLLNWVSYLSVNTLVLTDLIKVNLESLGIACPELFLDLGFTLLPFIVAFSGTRALSILHLFFAIPAFGLLINFCVNGLGWLAFSSDSPGFFPSSWSSLNFVDWAKWFFFVSYATYSCETASSFVADSRHPQQTLRFLEVAAWMMPPIFIGGSWVMIRLATASGLNNHAYLNLVTASKPFWGNWAEINVTFLLVSASLLGSATVVSNCPRILYQLALDKHISPVFSAVSRRGVFVPALSLTLVFCLIYLIWGDISRIVVAGNIGWFASFMLLHLGLWLRRNHPEVLFPHISLGILLLEIVVLLVGGVAWGWINLLISLAFPVCMMGVDGLIRHAAFPVFHLSWWKRHYRKRPLVIIKDSVILQVSILIILVCGAMTTGWLFAAKLNTGAKATDENLFVVLLMTVAFIGVAIACWTTLPQVVAIAEAQEAAEHLFTVAQDGILVLDEQGIIKQANPASESIFNIKPFELLGNHLSKWIPELPCYPQQWAKRSEHTLFHNAGVRTLEVSISDLPHQNFQEYVVILHDITQRKQAEERLRQSQAQLQQEAKQLASQLIQSEKMSSLGQLVAGVAHEINNPVSFIYGNLSPANEYIQDLFQLLQLYQQYYPNPVPQIKTQAKAIEIDFIVEDLPKLLTSMRIGAERIAEIVQSLRNFSRLDEAQMKVVNIHEGIDSTLMLLEHRLKSANNHSAITLIKKYGDLPAVECYPGQLNQVFMNILANAIDALDEAIANGKTTNNPQISILTNFIAEEQSVSISIADNGCGMPEHVQKRLFDPFFTTKPVGKGTGLGLSISYQIITQKHGGKLECISSSNEGTEFLITIPLQHSLTS